jgi:hypothetical protein
METKRVVNPKWPAAIAVGLVVATAPVIAQGLASAWGLNGAQGTMFGAAAGAVLGIGSVEIVGRICDRIYGEFWILQEGWSWKVPDKEWDQ